MTLINKQVPTNQQDRDAVPSSKLSVAGIYGAGGPSAGDNRALNAVVTLLDGTMFGPSETRRVRDYLNTGAAQGKRLLLFGYSRGGNSAIQTANMLGRMRIQISHLVIFDAHSVFDNRVFHLEYDNIGQAHNFFQRNPRSAGRYGWWGRNPYWGSRLTSNYIQVEQRNFTGTFHKKDIPVSHLNIVRQSLTSL